MLCVYAAICKTPIKGKFYEFNIDSFYFILSYVALVKSL